MSATDRPATATTPAPPLQLERLDGGRATLGSFPRGNHRKMLLIFTDPGCGPCQMLAPELVNCQSRASSDLPVTRADANTGRAAYSSLRLDHILLDPAGQAAKPYGADRFPTGILCRRPRRPSARPPASTRSSSSSPGWTGGRYSWMRTVLGADHRKGLYRKRMQMIEPVFGHTKHNRLITRFHRRGRTAVRAEWRLLMATHNLTKLHRHRLAAVGA